MTIWEIADDIYLLLLPGSPDLQFLNINYSGNSLLYSALALEKLGGGEGVGPQNGP